MNSKPTGSYTILNESNDIFLSNSLLTKWATEKANKNNPPAPAAGEESQIPQQTPIEMMRRHSSMDQTQHHNINSNHNNNNLSTEAPITEGTPMPLSMYPEYVAKNAQFDSLTNLYALRGEYEHKLQHYQHQWRSRIEEIERINQQLFKLNSEKFAADVDRVNEKFFKDHSAYETPCAKQESRITNCYKLNPDKPLLCSEEVRKFMDCVEQTRINLLKR